MPVRLRPTLASLPAYVPGRSVVGAIKLASNEIPYPPLPHVVERIAAIAGQANRYPDNFSAELTSELAARFGVGDGQVVVGCGSVALCQQLASATAGEGDEVLYGWRSFEAYPILTAITGATAVAVPLADARYDLAAMADAITERTRLVFVCNPNNPTGTAVPGTELTAFLDQVPSDVVVALDEAYREFVTDDVVIDGTTLLSRYPNVIVLRTFSKAYGLAGLRVGYGIAADEVITSSLRQTQVPFAVSQIAQEAALTSLDAVAEAELKSRVQEITGERDRVAAELRALGYVVPSSQSNFVWLGNGPSEAGGIDARGFAESCEQRGLIVRAFADSGVRVTISSTEENDRFLEAAAQLR